MTRAEHLQKAESLMELAHRLRSEPGRGDVAGEIIWGATVHAMSAADPEHGTGEHRSPNTARRFNAAAARVVTNELTMADLKACLENNQTGRHHHFYHGNLTEQLLDCRLTAGFVRLGQLLMAAADRLATPEA